MNEDWSKYEIEIIVKDYFEMLKSELDQLKYNKSEHRQAILPTLRNRTEGSIEFKHQNISAVLSLMGQPFIKGYKPRDHYQQILEEQIAKYLIAHRDSFEARFEKFSESLGNANLKKIDFNNILSEEPINSIVEEREPKYRPIKINYLEKEQNNRDLGEQGEQLVLEYEKWRLINAGKPNLADKIEWISKEKGDGAGFDILSRNINGTDRYVEVKTTKLSRETPIYLTRSEISFAKVKSNEFYLYRVFNFSQSPQIFIKSGEYEKYCSIQPLTFKGIF